MNNISNTNNIMELRDTITVKISDLNNHFENPEKICLELPESGYSGVFDIGIIAYSIRNYNAKNSTAGLQQPVCIASLQPARQVFLTTLFDHISTKSWRNTSVLGFIKEIRLLLNWTDSNNHTNLFDSEKLYRAAYFDFSNYMYDQVQHNKLKPITANTRQRYMAEMATIAFGDNAGKEIIAGISTIKKIHGPGIAPPQTLVKKNIDTFLFIARGYAQSFKNMEPYPWRLTMQDYHTYVLPASCAVKTPFTKSHSAIFDYVNGCFFTAEEMTKKNNRPVHQNKSDLKKAQINLENNNAKGLDCQYRLFDASMALTAYLQVFILMTGSYGSEVRQIEFDNESYIERCIIKNNFRAIKFRANGLTVKYNLGEKIGLQILKEYLELRKKVLGEKKCKFLFFSINNGWEPTQYSESFIEHIVKRASKLFFASTKDIIRSRKVRKHKSVVLHEAKFGTKVASALLNHKETTNEAVYTPYSPDTMQKEFKKHWSAVEKAAEKVKISNKNDQDISIPTGHCSSRNEPEKVNDDVPIEPDCKKQFGCLFCSKYVIHADKTDIHKLLSVKFVIEQVLLMSVDVDKAEHLLRELCVRIDYLLDRLKNLSESTQLLVKKLTIDVFDYGELTPFWTHRLNRYEEMGVIL
jgi:hypothetical protein